MSKMNVDPTTRVKTTGVYGGDLVPGTYIKTKTGAIRGEELFSRPDLERPWRTTEAQKRATTMALKEKEIEELMRLNSTLRTQLGNAKSDAQFLEYALTEKMKAQATEKEKTIAELNAKAEQLGKDIVSAKEDTEHQIRLLKSQNENDLLSTKNEARLAAERCAELAKTYQLQVDDVKAACMREVQFIESRFGSRVDELTAELKAVRESAKATEQHYQEQTTANTNMLNRVEDEYRERLRASEQRIDELRKSQERETEKQRTEKEAALAEARRAKKQLACGLVDKDEVGQRFKLWSNYILSGLDRFYANFVEAVPELAVEPVDPQLQEIPAVYAPRVILEEPEAKVTVERIAYRLLQLKHLSNYTKLQESIAGTEGGAGGQGNAAALEWTMSRAIERQERLKAALRETGDKMADADLALNNVLGRLYFFSDNLESALAGVPRHVQAPVRDVVFVCVAVAHGESLWAHDGDTMRTAVTLMETSIRLKMGQYGAYECYSDSTSMMLAFGDAAAACRFCAECQEWLVRTPWPAALLRNPLCREEVLGDKLLFCGLRVSMAMHAGECFVESSALPTSTGMYRSHYYGRAVSQILHVCSLAEGGQIVVTKPAWALCLKRRHELGQIAVTELGAFPIMSFNSQTGTQEKQSLVLYQISPQSLRDRAFKPTSKLDLPAVSSLAGAKRSILAAEIEVIESRRAALKEAMEIIEEEYKTVQNEMTALLARGRSCRSHFHLLPPPEMVTQMNDLYGAIEKVAVRAQEMHSDLVQLANMQEEMEVQQRGLKDYFRQQNIRDSCEDELRTEIDVSGQRVEANMAEARAKHRHEMERLQGAVQERDQMIRKLCQRIDSGRPAA